MTLESGLSQFLASESLRIMFELVTKSRKIVIRNTLTDNEDDSNYVMEGVMIVLETIAENGSATIK